MNDSRIREYQYLLSSLFFQEYGPGFDDRNIPFLSNLNES